MHLTTLDDAMPVAVPDKDSLRNLYIGHCQCGARCGAQAVPDAVPDAVPNKELLRFC